MRLLVVTDHAYHRTREGVYDAYCFDRGFFDDYRAVFDEVEVAARLSDLPPPADARRSDGDGVRFVPLRNVHGAAWALAPLTIHCGTLPDAVRRANAVCVRIPSVAGIFAARLARRYRKPLMFEQVGDPLAIAAYASPLSSPAASIYARVFQFQTRRITKQAVAGSYVSRSHLQCRYPASASTTIDSVSSIRLSEGDILPPRRVQAPPTPLRILLVASLVKVKDHSTLIRGVSEAARNGAPVALDLVGDGPLRSQLQGLARRLSLHDSVTLHGHVVGRSRIEALLDQADLFAMPSLNEGMPRSMLEAMSRGLPAIGADTTGISELLPADQLFPPRDHQRLGTMLTRLQRAPEALARLSSVSVSIARQFTNGALSSKRRRLLDVLKQHAISMQC